DQDGGVVDAGAPDAGIAETVASHPVARRRSSRYERIDEAVEATLIHRGLNVEDIASAPSTARALGHYRASKPSSRSEDVVNAATGMSAELNKLVIDQRLVLRKTERAGRGLKRSARDPLPLNRKLSVFDAQYMALREATLKKSPSEPELKRLLGRAAK